MPSSGNTTWQDGPTGGTPITAAALNNIEAAEVASVAKSGDTMTGGITVTKTGSTTDGLIISSSAGQLAEIKIQTAGVDRWKIRKSTDTESGSPNGSHLDFVRCDDSGNEIDTVVRLWRTGVTDLIDGANITNPPLLNANNVQVPNTLWVNSQWRGALAVPLNATYYYRTGLNTGTTAMANGNAYAMVFVAGRSCNINRLAVNVATAGSTGALIRLALVQITNPDTRAWTLVGDLGTIAATTTGVKELTGTLAVSMGNVYAVLAISQGSATTQPVLTYLIPGAGNAFGCTSNAAAITDSVPAFAVTGITGAVGASGTGTTTSISWACAVRADT